MIYIGKNFFDRWMKKNGYGIVLSGGGTKGAYEIGAWKAFRELHIPIQGVVGTSIGAIVAALMVQGDYPRAEEIFKTINIHDIMELHSDAIDPNKSLFHPENAAGLINEFVHQKGISNEPLRRMLEQNIFVEKIYNSSKDLGMMTFSVSDFTPQEIFKDNIPKEDLINYILASANFPIFKLQEADGKKLVDGGLADNMPINMLLKRGYRKLIVIDVNGTGLTSAVDQVPQKTFIKMIRASEDLGGTFEFDPQRIADNIHLGYLDTLKAFQKLFGHYYFFSRKAFYELTERFSLEIIFGLESAAKLYEIPRRTVYEMNPFLDLLMEKHNETREKYGAVQSEGYLNSILKNPGLITKMADSRMALVWFEEMIETWPGQSFEHLSRLFRDQMIAARAMIDLRGYLSQRWRI